MKLTVVLPCRNEVTTVGGCVRDARQGIANLGVAGEVLVVDNGSDDGSADVARRAGARVVVVASPGYGTAVRAGIAAAVGARIILADADHTYDLTMLGPFWVRLEAGDDMVVGNRFRGGIEPGAMPVLNQRIGNPALSGIATLLFRSAARDFHCGMRGFDRASIVALDLQSPGMELASEMIARAVRGGLIISEVPIRLRKSGGTHRSHLRPIRDGLRHLRVLAVVAVSDR